MSSLRHRLLQQYRQPFDELLDTPEVRAELGEFDLEPALTRLVGPTVFAKLIGIEHAPRADCARIVDDFLAARAAS
ncbi:hypothetical protein [Nocardia sp. CS682]|uniref:hypothetical protein n=1 Tax=Nocardia sp. CS682 TaxID=1047172 RepID=UPI001074E5B8|nr:hypothetical protein [Nocardia sp. CS682]QBS39676.1 hypothetical protein DMB37_05550 [Nocardia sp. CS682]